MNRELYILLISSNYFFPPIDGITVRDYNLFKGFSKPFRFDLLTFADEKTINNNTVLAKQLGPCFETVSIVPSSTLAKVEFMKRLSKFKNILFPHKLTMGKACYSEEMARAIHEKNSSSKYDLIFFCDFWAYLHFNRNDDKARYIVDVIDSPSLLMKSYFRKEKHFKKKITSYLNYMWAKRYEKIYLSKIKNMICVSPVDKDHIKRNCPQSNIWVVPNGVDTAYFKPRNTVARLKNTLLFTGVMDYPPNHESMVYFVKEVLPLVRKDIPDISLTIAGRNPTLDLQSLVHEISGIKITGFVDDIRGSFDDATVYVSPMISGTGLKNKMLEAWAMAKPVVATSMSCVSLDARDGQNVLIADETKRFAEKIITLLSNSTLRDKLSRNARKTVEQAYSWKNRARMLEKIFNEVLSLQKS